MDNTVAGLHSEIENRQTIGREDFLSAFNGLVRTATIHDDTILYLLITDS